MNPQEAAATTAVKQAEGYFTTLAHSFTIEVLIPLCMLGGMFMVLWYLLSKAQAKADFNIEKIFVDDAGKPSIMPVISLLAFGVSSWYLAVKCLNGKSDTSEFLYFLTAWSGAAVFIEFAKKWDGHLPGTKVISPTEVSVNQNTAQ